MQGQSLLPLLSTCGHGATTALEAPAGDHGEAAARGRLYPANLEATAIIDGDWKLVHNKVRPAELPEFELFDATSDPLDQKNVAAEHPEVVERLSKALDGWHDDGDGRPAEAGCRADQEAERRAAAAAAQPRLRPLIAAGCLRRTVMSRRRPRTFRATGSLMLAQRNRARRLRAVVARARDRAPGGSARRLFKPESSAELQRSPSGRFRRTEWRFDGDPPVAAAADSAGHARVAAGPGVAGLDGDSGPPDRPHRRTISRSSISSGRPGSTTADLVHAVEIRMRAPAGGNVWIQGVGTERVDLAEQINIGTRLPWPFRRR